jgi:hypothetical protein
MRLTRRRNRKSVAAPFTPYIEINRLHRNPLQGAEIVLRDELIALGHTVRYEPYRFFIRLGSGRITCMVPDFYLVDLELFIEVTEVRHEGEKLAKIAQSSAAFPEYPIVLVGRSQLAKFQQDELVLPDLIADADEDRNLRLYNCFTRVA